MTPDVETRWRSVSAGDDKSGDPEYSAWVRPVRAGYSFGLSRRVGTVGLLVRRLGGNRRTAVLSSSHVINRQPDGRDYSLYQPAGRDALDGVAPVGRAIQFTRLHPRSANRTEAGLAELFDDVPCDSAHPLGPLRGVCADVRVGQPLYKVSRTTGIGQGIVIDTNWQGPVGFGGRLFPFERQILIYNPTQCISLDGDSGAVWVTEEGRAAALNFAGSTSGRMSVSSPLALVFGRMAVCLPAVWE